MKRLLILAALAALAFSTVTDVGATSKKYVPFLGYSVSVAQLEERVYVTMDESRNSFGIDDVRAELGLTGAGVEVCVIDTGVAPSHEQLDSKDIAFFDAVNGQTAPYDDHGHGTFVAAQVAGDGVGGDRAARYEGVAPAAVISAAKVLNAGGSGSSEQVIAGIEWCAQRPSVDIISMSLGGSQSPADPMEAAVNVAVNTYGKVAVIAAGNSGSGGGSVLSPGSAAAAITVGAGAEWTSSSDLPNYSPGPFLAQFSSRGPTLDGRIKPDVVGPGVSVTGAVANTASDYTTWSGTSMATPFVAGTAALLLQKEPGLTPAEVKARITRTALDQGFVGQDNEYGWGYLDPPAVLGLTRNIFPAAHGSWTLEDTVNPHVIEFTVPPETVGGNLSVTAIPADSSYVTLIVQGPTKSWQVDSVYRQERLDAVVPAPGTYQIVAVTATGAPISIDAWAVPWTGGGPRQVFTWYLHGWTRCIPNPEIPRSCNKQAPWTAWFRVGTAFTPCEGGPKCQLKGVMVTGHTGRPRNPRPISCISGKDEMDATCQLSRNVPPWKEKLVLHIDSLTIDSFVYDPVQNHDESGDATPSGTREVVHRPW